jgi:hypothetical protein
VGEIYFESGKYFGRIGNKALKEYGNSNSCQCCGVGCPLNFRLEAKKAKKLQKCLVRIRSLKIETNK